MISEEIDNKIKITFFNNNGLTISSRMRNSYIEKLGIVEYLNQRYFDSESIQESIYRIKHGNDILIVTKKLV